MIVYGKNVFNELKNNTKNIKKVYFGRSFTDREIIDFVKENKIAYETVDLKRLDDLAEGNHQGIVALINDYEYHDLNSCVNEEFVLILDHLEDPHNLGAIIRSAEAGGIKSIIIPKDRSVGITPTVMKISSGALNHVKIIMVTNLVETIKKLQEKNFFIYGAESDGTDYRKVDYATKNILVIGSEGSGLSRLVKKGCDEIISIPMSGQVNSLNASVAAGILIFGIKNK